MTTHPAAVDPAVIPGPAHPDASRHRERVGTMAWSRRTGGHLTAADKRAMLPSVACAHAKNVGGRLSMLARLNRGRRRELDLARLAPPSTILTWVAEAHAQHCLSPAILNHSRRTYAFGAALGALEGLDVDHELLYAASLLHDIGLPGGTGDGSDFTVASAAVALQLADDVGLPPAAAETLASAITLHHSPDVSLADGPVAFLLSAGAALDVIGLRAWELPPAALAGVVERHPRAGFTREFAQAFRAEAERVPDGRARFLYRYGAFGVAIRSAPFRG
jgi:hypothetical protein